MPEGHSKNVSELPEMVGKKKRRSNHHHLTQVFWMKMLNMCLNTFFLPCFASKTSLVLQKIPGARLSGDLHQLVSGLQHLHSRRVLHSDIKVRDHVDHVDHGPDHWGLVWLGTR